MSLIVDSIFTEWRASLPEGSSHPNTQNGYHLFLLKEICLKRGISENIINSVLLALEAKDDGGLDADEIEKAKSQGLVSQGFGRWGKDKDGPMTHKTLNGKLVPANKDDLEKQKSDKEKEKVGAQAGGETDGPQIKKPETNPLFQKDGKTDDNLKNTGGLVDPKTNKEEIQTKQVKQNAERNKASWDKISKLEGPAKEAAKNKHLSNQLDNMLVATTRGTGAGRYNMSSKDIKSYRTYVQKMMDDPDNQPKKMIDEIKARRERQYGKIEEEDIDNFIDNIIKENPKLKSVIMKKGTPGASYYKQPKGDERFRAVVKAYLETGGISPITGEVVPFSECQLDHITSLGNGGEDGPDNWMFMEERFNQFKRKKTDESVRADLEGEYWKTEAEIAAGVQSKETDNFLKEEDRNFWKDKFEKEKKDKNPKDIGLSKNQLENMSRSQLNNLVVGHNRANPDDELTRYSETKVDYNGQRLVYARGEGDDNPVKPVKDDPSTWGVVVQDGKGIQKYPSDDYETSLKRYQDNRPSGGIEKNKDEYIDMLLEAGVARDSTDVDEAFEKEIRDHRTGQNIRDKERKAVIKKAKEAPGSYDKKNQEVKKTMKIWDLDNPEPYGKGAKDYIKKANDRQKQSAWQKWKKKRDIYLFQQWKKYDSTNRLQP